MKLFPILHQCTVLSSPLTGPPLNSRLFWSCHSFATVSCCSQCVRCWQWCTRRELVWQICDWSCTHCIERFHKHFNALSDNEHTSHVWKCWVFVRVPKSILRTLGNLVPSAPNFSSAHKSMQISNRVVKYFYSTNEKPQPNSYLGSIWIFCLSNYAWTKLPGFKNLQKVGDYLMMIDSCWRYR